MERVELLTELEQRFGVRVPTDRAHEIFTVGQLVDAVRPGDGQPAGAPGRGIVGGVAAEICRRKTIRA